MGEWLGALGLAWPRLLFYPGGLTALLLAWLAGHLLLRDGGKAARGHARAAADRRHLPDLSACVTPLLLISLLPLPRSGYFGYTPDILTALVLLEWPLLLALARHGMADAPLQDQPAPPPRLPLSGYLALILAILLLAQLKGTFRLEALTNSIEPPDRSLYLLHLLGMLGWSAALLPLLGMATPAPDAPMHPLRWGLRLRLVGHLLLALLPWLPFVRGYPWAALLPLAGLIALLAITPHLGRRLTHRQQQALQGLLLGGLILAIGWQTYAALTDRLT